MATQTYTDGVTLSAAAEFNRFDTVSYAVLSGVAGTNTITATGPANYTYAATTPPVWFIPAVTNTGATTINITPSGGAALGAKNIFSGGVACVGGELVAGVPAGIIYDGTQYHLLSSRYAPSSFTATLTGCATAPTGTVYAVKTGSQVTIDVPAYTATSNATTKTLTGMPAPLRPATLKRGVYTSQDNSATAAASLFTVETSGVITLYPNADGNAWTASGTFVSRAFTITYTLN